MSPNGVRNVIGIIGNILSVCIFIAPAPIIWEILRMKAVGGFSAVPYLATILDCALWLLYGMPFVHPNNILVLSVNAFGLVMELFYILIYLIYAAHPQRRQIIWALVAEFLSFVSLVIIGVLASHSYQTRTKIVGSISVITGFIMYASPLIVTMRVIRERNVQYLSLYLSLSNFFNGVVWTIYGFVGEFDIFIILPNALGTLLGVAQLVLYIWFHNAAPIQEEGEPNKEEGEGESNQGEGAAPNEEGEPNQGEGAAPNQGEGAAQGEGEPNQGEGAAPNQGEGEPNQDEGAALFQGEGEPNQGEGAAENQGEGGPNQGEGELGESA